MIRVAITGAGTPDSGELIRLLAMHPDVEITAARCEALQGKSLAAIHHGLIGETSLTFTSSADFPKCDVLFVGGDDLPAAELMRLRTDRPELKIIMLNDPELPDPERFGIVYGLPEINRKLLVRGATAAVVPRPFASMALVALFPFAKHLLLGGKIEISVAAPAAILDATDIAKTEREIEKALLSVQSSFTGNVSISTHVSEARRSALMDISFGCPLSLQQMIDLYEIYDDHRFSFVTTSSVGVSEVAGTNKCVVRVSRGDKPGECSIGVAADCRLRGGAGEAVHIMNLMCGLHEKTGLNLKAIDFEPV
ncbi:MAG: hypothetical protein K2L59_06735 [Muribaculaceae bacterium]|nr:hypothetical protein [Muribaculaceae bacterium]